MNERIRPFKEVNGEYPPMGGDDELSTRGEMPLQVQERKAKAILNGYAYIISTESTLDSEGRKRIKVSEKYFKIE